MKPIKTKPRFCCDFYSFSATEPTVAKHEKICWRNPNRFCETCKNRGYYTEVHGDLVEEGDGGLSEDIPCPYCSQFKPQFDDNADAET